MRTGITFEVTTPDRTRLKAIAADRNSPQKHVWRANIVLLAGAGCGTAEIMRQTGKAKTCVWRWQERYMQAGVDGLLKDKPRPSRKPPLPKETFAWVVELTLCPPPGKVTHWTASAMAKASGISASSVQRIWRSHGLAPHPANVFSGFDPPFDLHRRFFSGFDTLANISSHFLNYCPLTHSRLDALARQPGSEAE